MNWLVFVIAFLYVCVGYVLGAFLGFRRRPSARADAAATDAPGEAANDEISQIDQEQVRQFLERLQELTTSVDDGVDRHTSRVAAISDKLTDRTSQDSSAVLAVATQLIQANQKLQSDLESAQVEIQVQRQQLDSYMTEARTDGLTGLANRRAFDQELNRQIAHWQDSQSALCLALVDVDYFKKFNDIHGHQTGDEVLRCVSRVLAATLRETDLVARYGGEEFAVVLPATTADEAKVTAERLREAIAARTFSYEGSDHQITVSVGLAEALATDDADLLLKRVDIGLYAAKEAGRNCGYFHNGQTCEPIETLHEQIRRCATNRVMRIAPFINGRFPERAMFREIQCQNVSARGFSYRLSAPPDYEFVILAACTNNGPSYMTASIKDYTNHGSDTNPLYQVNCEFTSRADFGDDLGSGVVRALASMRKDEGCTSFTRLHPSSFILPAPATPPV